jgi:hypothetical protein
MMKRAIFAQVMVMCASMCALAHADALIHRYSFDDGTANDSVGRASGKLLGGVTVSEGQARFTGAPGQRIELLADGIDGIHINTLKAVTIEAWYTGADAMKAYQLIFDFGDSSGVAARNSSGAQYLLFAARFPHNESRALITDSDRTGEASASGPAAITSAQLNQERYVAVVLDEYTLTVYLDGREVAETDLTSQSLSKLSNHYALLGGSLFGSDPALVGSINEFRIYDAALSPMQIKSSYSAGPNTVAIR